jgi:hypothetical protein
MKQNSQAGALSSFASPLRLSSTPAGGPSKLTVLLTAITVVSSMSRRLQTRTTKKSVFVVFRGNAGQAGAIRAEQRLFCMMARSLVPGKSEVGFAIICCDHWHRVWIDPVFFAASRHVNSVTVSVVTLHICAIVLNDRFGVCDCELLIVHPLLARPCVWHELSCSRALEILPATRMGELSSRTRSLIATHARTQLSSLPAGVLLCVARTMRGASPISQAVALLALLSLLCVPASVLAAPAPTNVVATSGDKEITVQWQVDGTTVNTE